MNIIRIFGVLCLASLFTGCMATQPVTWNKNGPMDLSKGGRVVVAAACDVPPSDLAFLQSDVQQQVSKILPGSPDAADAYRVNLKITRYDPGNAFARFMLIGLGQMYLDGSVEVSGGESGAVVREGGFRKNYCVGGMVGGMASMQKDVLPKVGPTIAAALKEQSVR